MSHILVSVAYVPKAMSFIAFISVSIVRKISNDCRLSLKTGKKCDKNFQCFYAKHSYWYSRYIMIPIYTDLFSTVIYCIFIMTMLK